MGVATPHSDDNRHGEPFTPRGAELLARIRRLLGERARRRLDSADVFQGVALEWARLPESRRPRRTRSLLRWGTAVAKNDVVDALRRGKPESEPAEEPIDSDGGSPATRAEGREELDRLANAIAELNEDHRRVVELRDLHGLSFQEIAIELERTESAAQMLHARALARLGRRLRRDEP